MNIQYHMTFLSSKQCHFQEHRTSSSSQYPTTNIKAISTTQEENRTDLLFIPNSKIILIVDTESNTLLMLRGLSYLEH